MNSTEFAKLMYCKIFEMENEDNDCNVTAVLDAVKNLTEREQNALQCRYLFGYTLKEIAEKMNLTSRESARQIISRALIKLRNMPSSNDMKISNIIRERDFYKAANEKAQRDLAEMKIVLKNIKQDLSAGREATNIVSVEDLEFSMRTFNCLKRAGYKTVSDILNIENAQEVHKIRNFGAHSFEELMSKMEKHGFTEWVEKIKSSGREGAKK